MVPGQRMCQELGSLIGWHITPQEDWTSEGWTEESMHSWVQGPWIHQGKGKEDVWEGGLLRLYAAGEE